MTTWICILNWNGGRDTLATLQTVLTLPDAVVCILDNGSTDDSIPVLQAYLREQAVPFALLSSGDDLVAAAAEHRVLLVRSPENTGFAGGNNILLQAALQAPEARYAWLLNNDALANTQTLPALTAAMQGDARLGFAGSVILDGKNPHLVQCCGVRYFRWLGISKLLAKDRPYDALAESSEDREPDFQHGASLLVRLDAARAIGLLDDRFFLYFEEQDWQRRGGQQGWSNRLVMQSTVVHLGSMSTDRHKHLFFYYYNRSAAIFARLHNPWFVRLCNRLALPAILFLRTRGQLKSLRWGWKGLRQGWRTPL